MKLYKYLLEKNCLPFPELNSPKSTVQINTKTRDPMVKLPTSTPEKHPIVENEVYTNDLNKYLMCLEIELKKVLNSDPSSKLMKNMGMHLASIFYIVE